MSSSPNIFNGLSLKTYRVKVLTGNILYHISCIRVMNIYMGSTAMFLGIYSYLEKTVLLSCNLRIIQLTYLKHTVQWFLAIFTESRRHHQDLILEYVHFPPRNHEPISSHFPAPPSRPVPGTHSSTVHLCRFACSEHFI